MAAKAAQASGLTITAPDFKLVRLNIKGTSPLVINKFSAKAQAKMQATQEAGGTSKSKKNRDPKDFEECFNGARHIGRGPEINPTTNLPMLDDEDNPVISGEWDGIHAASFRNAAISACRAAGYVMTQAKLALFIEADGFDIDDHTPLVRITKGEPEMVISPCRNASGVIDLRARPTYFPWEATLRIRYDAGMLTSQDIINLMTRVGMQVGIGEGRPDSKKSAGLGNGLFEIDPSAIGLSG
nr:hypothetical protein 8 [bacterium]